MRALGFLLLCVLHGDAFFNIPSIPSPTTRNLAGLFSNLGGRHPVRSATLRLAPRPSKVGIRGGSMVASSAVSSTDPVAKVRLQLKSIGSIALRIVASFSVQWYLSRSSLDF
jgi:hypothetical protein